ncbi:MAG: peptide deformylase [Actinomycetota bacterium]|nr:peptide deformylase [Acidimicrobiales bacterium]MEC8921322.1 peptide deformylase [Actinomycetota bacterium]MED5551402.1 peptide deformylase [Actinomycetota bacterium]MEE2680236.1 peptide deformylase [Actinomycetota bacterium]MEE3140165.1 peptide deformylase [Actinomycetota bacterium]
MSYQIRVLGDPVLRQEALPIENIDGRVVRMVKDMVPVMYEAEGIGLAAPQVGIQKRLFVYDMGEGPQTLVNPQITESDGEWAFEEGCLSVPGLSFEIIRPKQVHLVGRDLEGNEVSIEADELLSRLFQHELDHLDGILLLDHLDRDQRKAALSRWREIQSLRGADDLSPGGLSLS